jgi:hypothetical protein
VTPVPAPNSRVLATRIRSTSAMTQVPIAK